MTPHSLEPPSAVEELKLGKQPPPRRVFAFVTAAAIAVYFYWLSRGGLRAKFSHDDLMNMYRAWLEPLSQLLKENVFFFLYPLSYRPFGGLFYHVFFELFGLHPLPYRIFLLLFLLANMYLAYAVLRRLSGSREVAVLAVLLHCYHVNFAQLYKNTGTCYDIFCFSFYFAGLLYYLRIRQAGRFLRPIEHVGFLGLLILALNSKEMAVTLPVLIGAYELFYHPPVSFHPRRLISWLIHEGQAMCWGALANIAFIAGKLYPHDGVARNSGQYFVTISLASYFRSLQHDLNEVFITWSTGVFSVRNLAIILAILMLIAWRLRLASFKFGLAFWLVGIAPVAFIPPRNIYDIYIPLVGFSFCAAILLVAAREAIWRGARVLTKTRTTRNTRPGFPEIRETLTFVLLLVLMGRFQLRNGAHLTNWMDDQGKQIMAVAKDLKAQLPDPKKGAHLLFLKNPFEKAAGTEWATIFLSRLLYRDQTIDSDRLWKLDQKPNGDSLRRYDAIFTVVDDRVIRVAPSSVESQP
ncbi:MAG: glycosyltransferase family 39 protein [Bryobacteraceae bacterium]